MAAKPNPDAELQEALAKQRKHNQDIDRILWIVLPIFAFLLGFIISNLNIYSALGTVIVLTISFISVGIKRKSLALTLIGVLFYCLIDNYLSHKYSFNIERLKNHLLCMVLFVSIVGMMRSMTDRALANYHKNDPK